jgi:ankyrin repeat protein
VSNQLRSALIAGDLDALSLLLGQNESIARQVHTWGADCIIGPCQPISFLAQARFNGFVKHIFSREMTRMLLASGAPVNGDAQDKETPLITAASYNEIGVARALIESGANLEATGYAVPGGTALAHAIEFGAVEIVDLLVAAGATIASFHEAAGAGHLPSTNSADELELALALRAASFCNRLNVIDRLLATGLSVNLFVKGGTPLHWVAWQANAASTRHLLTRGADPSLKDPKYHATPLEWARHRANQCPHAHPGGHSEVIQLLENL